MNCFEWQSRSSDYLDGALIGPEKKAADDHLDSCRDCTERHQHYRLIITSIAGQPRSSLPIPIRKSPMNAMLSSADLSRQRKGRWERIPWSVKTVIEGSAVILIILVAVSVGPKLRQVYERRMERNLGEFTDDFKSANGEGQPLAAPDRGTGQNRAADTAALGGPAASPGDDFGSEGEDTESAADSSEADSGDAGDDQSREIKVGSSEIWRFNLKTDSPHEIRPKVVQLLADQGVPRNTPGLNGIEAPGGLQFDLLVSRSAVPGLKRLLQKIAPTTPHHEAADAPVADTFTWYKNKSKRKLPDGKTRVVIWLSQM